MLEDSATGPIFVHCKRGADRTGAVIAAYHIDHDKWNNARALQDAKAHSMSVFQIPRQRYIQDFRPRVIDAKATVPADGAGAAIAVAATP
jgi:protein-tyrosine phosphatase